MSHKIFRERSRTVLRLSRSAIGCLIGQVLFRHSFVIRPPASSPRSLLTRRDADLRTAGAFRNNRSAQFFTLSNEAEGWTIARKLSAPSSAHPCAKRAPLELVRFFGETEC